VGKYSYFYESKEEITIEPKGGVVLVEVGKEDNV
jgi:hypothetical protein